MLSLWKQSFVVVVFGWLVFFSVTWSSWNSDLWLLHSKSSVSLMSCVYPVYDLLLSSFTFILLCTLWQCDAKVIPQLTDRMKTERSKRHSGWQKKIRKCLRPQTSEWIFRSEGSVNVGDMVVFEKNMQKLVVDRQHPKVKCLNLFLDNGKLLGDYKRRLIPKCFVYNVNCFRNYQLG